MSILYFKTHIIILWHKNLIKSNVKHFFDIYGHFLIEIYILLERNVYCIINCFYKIFIKEIAL